MKKYILTALMLMLCACNDNKPISLYAINMMYACECPRYRIIMVENSKNRLMDSEIDLDKNASLNTEIKRIIELEKIENNSLIGLDLDLKFENTKQEMEFSKSEGISPICNIYRFEGVLQQGLFSKAIFYVKDYTIIPKSKTCVSQSIK
ncbi:hypothetical protein DCO58_08195 [Helicobacter saguini]|uniref:Lipoprotein n=2 Tax=Helicobacter saguini TaxID=1548018 RepID=A0A347VNN7_9HELI|nr:hypothetical protein [Helicobacter saguini]MWV67632.1 hypothetical protein [Helicobacter saguini]MWV69983.1 hypothetical protein [Helicobacter saguini]MWV72803.1 hypothetical protein [Helicobacter saguini]TLD92002.1 hypothetical protein LS64_011065 [Helicobacter saguini]